MVDEARRQAMVMASAGLPLHRRPVLRTLRRTIANPLNAWPAQLATQAVVRTSLLGRETLFVTEPALIGALLNDQADAFLKGETMARVLRPALGRGLLTAEGAHWRWQRRAAAPVFRPDRLDGFLPAMLASAARMRGRWQALAPETEVELCHEMTRTTFDIITATMLSDGDAIDPAGVARNIDDYLRSVGWAIALGLAGAPGWTPYPGRRRAERACAALRCDMLRLIAERRSASERRGDLLGLLLDAHDGEGGQTMDDDEVADNLLTFIAAGHETTAVALSWTVRLLAEHPPLAARLRDEVAVVTGGEPLAPAHVARLALTRQVVQEAMRLFPPAAALVRRATRDVTLDGLAVAAGTAVYVPIYALHRRAALWPDPDRFDPDRFAPELVRGRHRYAYLPFGGGPRICIGAGFAMLEAVAILATLLPAIDLVAPSGARPAPMLRITLRPTGGLPQRISPRR